MKIALISVLAMVAYAHGFATLSSEMKGFVKRVCDADAPDFLNELAKHVQQRNVSVYDVNVLKGKMKEFLVAHINRTSDKDKQLVKDYIKKKYNLTKSPSTKDIIEKLSSVMASHTRHMLLMFVKYAGQRLNTTDPSKIKAFVAQHLKKIGETIRKDVCGDGNGDEEKKESGSKLPPNVMEIVKRVCQSDLPNFFKVVADYVKQNNASDLRGLKGRMMTFVTSHFNLLRPQEVRFLQIYLQKKYNLTKLPSVDAIKEKLSDFLVSQTKQMLIRFVKYDTQSPNRTNPAQIKARLVERLLKYGKDVMEHICGDDEKDEDDEEDEDEEGEEDDDDYSKGIHAFKMAFAHKALGLMNAMTELINCSTKMCQVSLRQMERPRPTQYRH